MNLSVALDALDILATVLREEVPMLEPTDLLAVLQLLKQVSDLEIQEGDELEMLEQLGQYYMEVTESILEEQNTGTWSSISQVMVPPVCCVPHLFILGLLHHHRLVLLALRGHLWPLWPPFSTGKCCKHSHGASSAQSRASCLRCLVCWMCSRVLVQASAVLVVPPLQTPLVVNSALFKFSPLSVWIGSLQIPGAVSLPPHPTSGRDMPCLCSVLCFLWMGCQGAVCHQPPHCSKHRQALHKGFPSSHPCEVFLCAHVCFLCLVQGLHSPPASGKCVAVSGLACAPGTKPGVSRDD